VDSGIESRSATALIVVEIREGRIAAWREYQRKGPGDFGDFIAHDDKDWQWHIGNYP
jgi:hypothetical protein